MKAPTPDLSEARRLLDAGYRLCKLKPYLKQPEGDAWNLHPVKRIDPMATGYGVLLQANKLCSIDPDRWEQAVIGMRALGFDLEQIMRAGVRTRSTRTGSGGRSAFAAEGEICWLKFSSPDTGTVLELRAHSENLQDVLPGLVYRTKDGEICSQTYANGRRLDDAPPLPDDLFAWWERCSTDVDFLREQQRRFFEAIGARAHQAISTGRTGGVLAFPAQGIRGTFNAVHTVESILERHGYSFDRKSQRWAPPTATGEPGVRPIPGKDGLWRSDHASDPLHGTFDAWAAHVVLDHAGDADAAIAAAKRSPAKKAPPAADGTSAGDGDAHPLTAYLSCHSATLKRPEFIIDGVIAAGFVLVAGSWGAGKTSQLVPLLMRAAHLCRPDDPLRPLLRRRVVYVTEDAEQVRMIVASMRTAGELDGITEAEVDEWFRPVQAKRLPPVEIVKAAAEYADLATVNRSAATGREYMAQAVIVFDTRSAVIALDDENDNAEASAAIAALRQGMPRNPVIVVTHLAKALKRADVKELTGRGAGAWEADAQQVLYLVRDDDTGTRWLDVATPKHRFTATCDGVEFTTHRATVTGEDQLGNAVDIHLVHGVPRLVGLGERRQQAQQAAQQQDDERNRERERALRGALLDAAEIAWRSGLPHSPRGLIDGVAGFKTDDKRATRDRLLSESWLVEVRIPPGWRPVNNARKSYLVALTADERRRLIESGELPTDKTNPPPSVALPPADAPDENDSAAPRHESPTA